MNNYIKVLIGIVSLLVLVVLANIGLNFWIEKKLPSIINENNDSPYLITYKDVNVSLFDSNIIAKDIVVIPKDTTGLNGKRIGLYAHVKTIKVNDFAIWDILFSDKLRANNVIVSKPIVLLFNPKEKPDQKKKSEKPFSKIVIVSAVAIDSGNFKMFDELENPILSLDNVNAKVDGILVTDNVLERKIPFAFDKYSFSYDSLFYKPNKFYDIRTGKLEADNSKLTIRKLAYIPKYSREAFVKAIPKEKDLYAINSGELSISGLDWGFKDEKFFFHSTSIIVDRAFANIYRGKMPADDLTKKPLFNKLLRDIPFDMKINTVAVRNSTLQYEEEKTFEKGAGMLTFSKFNLYATNVSSAFEQTKVPDVKIHINCTFMESSPMKVDWSLNPLDKSDGFNIRGNIQNFPAENLEPFTKPYMNVTAKGMLSEVYFNFTGNDKISRGDFAVNYDDLKVTVFKKNDRKKKNKLLSAISNLFVKNDTDKEVKSAEIEVERIPEKSFFNFLWRSVAEGLKKILV